jgi:hypothetical protein
LSEDGQKNRAFRCKSSEAPMRFLWAFRYNPLRAPAAHSGIAYAQSIRNSYPHPLAQFCKTKLRDVPPGFFAVRRKKTCLYHRWLLLPRLQVCHQARSEAEYT